MPQPVPSLIAKVGDDLVDVTQSGEHMVVVLTHMVGEADALHL